MKAIWNIGRLEIQVRWPPRKILGPFGGGWITKINIAIGPRTLLIEFLYPSLMFYWSKK